LIALINNAHPVLTGCPTPEKRLADRSTLGLDGYCLERPEVRINPYGTRG